jgi:HlyD family secretion protein
MDRIIAPEIRRNRIARRAVIAVIVVFAALFSIAATVQWLRPSIRRRNVVTAKVERGSVDATLQGTGTILPAVEQLVSSPVEARLLRIVRRAGDRVQAGDELVALDTSASRLEVGRLDDRVAQKESETAQTRLKLQETVASLRAQIEQKKLDREITQYRAEQNEKLHREGLVAQTENLAAATAAKKSDIELAQLREALARAERSAEAELTAAALELRTLRNERDESRRQLALAMMHADRAGVVTSIVQEPGATIRRGDVIARIADLSSFRVVASISDIHAAELAPGQRVRVKIDDATSIGGAISSIDPRVENGAVKFSVDLDQPSHPRLRNNVRVDVFVIVGQRNGVLRIRRGSLGQSDAEDVFVVRGDELVATPVRWGLAGEDVIEVKRGLEVGDEVVITNMSDYAGVKKLKLN